MNSPAVIFDTDIEITGELALSNGILYFVNNKFLTILDHGSSNEGSKTSFVDGKIRKIGDDPFIFPLGKGDHWARIEISAPTEVTTFDAEYYNQPHNFRDKKDMKIEKISPVEYWNLNKIEGNGKVRVSLYWEDASRSGINDLEALIVVKRNETSGEWISFDQYTSPSGDVGEGKSGRLTGSDLIEEFSPFTFGHSSSGSALPIELLSFDVQSANEAVQLRWKTSTEINNDYFTIERSTDNINFAPVLTVKGAGNSNEELSYQAIDNNPYDGTSYYRLKQTDYDGQFEYFDVKAVQINSSMRNFEISKTYPNPFENTVTISYSSELEGNGTLHIVDFSGKEISSSSVTINSGINEFSYDGTNLTSGIYLMYLSIGSNKTNPIKSIKK